MPLANAEITVAQLDVDPYPTYARLRREQPVAWVPAVHSFFVTRWHDVQAMAADPVTFSAAVHDSPLTSAIGPNLLHSDGAYHDQLRAPLTDNLRPTAIARRMRDVVATLVDRLLDRVEGDTEVDLVTDFAQPLAISVLTKVTGLPRVSQTTLVRWLDGIAAGASNYERDPTKTGLANAACREVDGMLVGQLRAGPPDGSLIAALAATPVQGRPMAFAELAATVKLLLIGGMQEPRDLFGLLIEEIESRHASGTGPWSHLTLRVERFAPRPSASAGSEADLAFDVELHRTGRTVHVAHDRTILDALQAANVLVPSTCREGICGSCETAVLAGDVDHRDSVLGPAERARNDALMVCVSRARSPRLVLDL